MNRRAAAVLAEIGLAVPPDTITGKLSVAQQQMVAIARVVELNSRIVVLDEPTAALAAAEVDALFAIIQKLKRKGIGIVYISHRLEELDVVADRVSVFRDGSYITTLDYRDTSKEELISLMVGRELTDQYPNHHAARGEELLRVNRLTTRQGLDVSDFVLHRGEIVGIYGLVGAGRTEFARALFGADRAEQYDVLLRGRPLKVRDTAQAVRSGLGYLTEDRKRDGLALGLDVENNITLANLEGLSRFGVMQQKACEENAEKYVEELKIRTPSTRQLARFLSGGNQQKVIIAKWLSRQCRYSDLRRADPGHRRGRAQGGLRAVEPACGGRGGRHRHLLRPARGHRRVGPHPGHARPAFHRWAGQGRGHAGKAAGAGGAIKTKPGRVCNVESWRGRRHG